MTPEEKRQARMQRFTQNRNKRPLPAAIEETSEKEQQETEDAVEKGHTELTNNNDDHGEDNENNDA